MVKLLINNKQQQFEIEDDIVELFEEIVEEAARLEGYSEGEISVALLDNEEIQTLNKKYLNKDQPTDVLSFPMGEDIWGDILISVERAYSQAEEYGHSFKRELCYLLTHGVLHLLGYNHKNSGDKNEMRQKEERILSKFNLSRD